MGVEDLLVPAVGQQQEISVQIPRGISAGSAGSWPTGWPYSDRSSFLRGRR